MLVLYILYTYYRFILTCFDAGACCPRMRVLTHHFALSINLHSVIILFTQKLIDCILTCRASCTQLWKYAVCLTAFTKSIWMECAFQFFSVAPFSLNETFCLLCLLCLCGSSMIGCLTFNFLIYKGLYTCSSI